jgi:bidirectional [NiFe] hydrogenase diaphorase subunit
MSTAQPTTQSMTQSVPVDKRFRLLEAEMKRSQYRQDTLIEVLHKAQEMFGYLEEDVLIYVARRLKLPLSRVYGVATFYHLFSLKPQGKHNCTVCTGTACYVKGSDQLLAVLKRELDLSPGETTADGRVSLDTTYCIGTCGIALAAMYDDEIVGEQTPESLMAQIRTWLTAAP